MRQDQLYLAESLQRVQQFLDAHASVVGAVNSTKARRQLDAAVAQHGDNVVEQDTRSREARGETNRRRQLERELRFGHMGPITEFARAQLAGVPNFEALTPSANDLQGARLVTAARSMASAAEPFAEHFVEAQFPQQIHDVGATTVRSVIARNEFQGAQTCR